jgi:peroxiredoxin
VVFGVSADTVESHKGFAEKEKLNFPLLADPGKGMIKAYGVLGSSGFPNRVTFIIGPDGNIASIDQAVNDQFERGGPALKTRHGDNLALALTDWKAGIGQSVPNISLPTNNGKTVSLYAPRKKATVVFFMGRNCPASDAYHSRMANLALDPTYKDINFFGVAYDTVAAASPTRTEATVRQGTVGRAIRTLEEIERLIDGLGAVQRVGGMAGTTSVPFPVAIDIALTAADHFQARVTPSVWVVDSKGIAVYTGAIDDNQDPSRVNSRYLKNALDSILANKTVSVSETNAMGCVIKR